MRNFHGENWHNTPKNVENTDYNYSLVTKNLMHHAGRNWEHSFVPFHLTLCGFMLKKVDWGGKHPINSVVDWQSHGTYPKRHNISEVDWGAHHDSCFFLFLVNIDLMPSQKISSHKSYWEDYQKGHLLTTTLRSINHVEGKMVHHLELQKDPSHPDHQLDQQRVTTYSPCPQHESSYNLLNQWDPGENPLLP